MRDDKHRFGRTLDDEGIPDRDAPLEARLVEVEDGEWAPRVTLVRPDNDEIEADEEAYEIARPVDLGAEGDSAEEAAANVEANSTPDAPGGQG